MVSLKKYEFKKNRLEITLLCQDFPVDLINNIINPPPTRWVLCIRQVYSKYLFKPDISLTLSGARH